MRSLRTQILWLALFCVIQSAACGEQEAKDYVPKLGEFPPADAGHYFAGELVMVDHVNRRAALRLDGSGVEDEYHNAASHRFAMLPYGSIRYHGAPAELRDIPLGTHLHGYFLLPPAGDNTISKPRHGAQYVPKYNHAFSLEDDFSFYRSRGRAWKVLAVDLQKGKLRVASSGEASRDGLKGEMTFEIDRSTRVWKGRGFAELEDLAADKLVQVNLTWAPGWMYREFHCADIWLDEESLNAATERQRRIHRRHAHHRWLAGWVDQVQHEPDGKGVVEVTVFGGVDPSLLEEVKERKSHGFAVAAAEPTLRSWWQEHDSKHGAYVELLVDKSPPPGSSGIRLRLRFDELLEGFRPGRIVRLRCHDWPNVKLPPEERIKSVEELESGG